MPKNLSTLLNIFAATALFASFALAQAPTDPVDANQVDTNPQTDSTNAAAASQTNKALGENIQLIVAGQPQPAFYLSELSGKAHGGVLLIPDIGRSPTIPGNISALRHSLASKHWHTLALDTSDSSDTHTQQMIAAGISYLNQQGVFNIAILGEGIGAAQAIHYIAALPVIDKNQGGFEQIRALIMINAKNSIPGSRVNTLGKLGVIRQPILDAYSSSELLKQQQATNRKRAARVRTGSVLYQQIRLPLISHFQQQGENRVTKQVRGWLDKNVAGFMVDGR